MFSAIPKVIMLSIFLIKSLDLREGLRLVQELIYLWREFNIKVRIIPKIQYFILCFSYKDIQLKQVRTERLKDLIEISEEIKRRQCEKGKDINWIHQNQLDG